MEFDDVQDYVRAFTKNRSLAVIPVSMASELFGITNAGVVARVKSNALAAIRISGTRYITLESVMDVMDKFDREVDCIKAYLEEKARSGVASVEYGPVMKLLGLSSMRSADRIKIGWILGAVSRRSYEEREVLLSVIVHRKNTNMPSENGFFGLVDDLIEDWEDDYDNRESFVKSETKRVLKAYKN